MAAYQTVTLTGTYQTPDGTPHKGHVEIIPSERVIKDTTGDIILTGRVKVELDAQGAFTVALPATDDPTLNPSGFGYTIAAKLHSSHPPAVSFSLPASLGATTVEDLTPVDPATFEPTTTYAEKSELDAVAATIPTTAADVNALPDSTVIPTTPSDIGAGVPLPTPLADATLTPQGTNVAPFDADHEQVYGQAGGNIHTSTDGETWTLAAASPDPAAACVRLIPTNDGEVVATTATSLYKSSGWGTGTVTWTQKLDAGAAQFLPYNTDGDGTKFIASHYDTTRPNSRYAWISTDAGETWTQVWDSVARFGQTAADESHVHACAYDPWADVFYISEGHNAADGSTDIAGIYHSTDNGATWTRAPGMVQNPGPTVICATDDGLVLGSDSEQAGVHGAARTTDPNDQTLEYLWSWRTGEYGIVGHAKMGWRRPDGTVYVSFEVEKNTAPVVAVATATSAREVWSHTTGAPGDKVLQAVATPTGDLIAYALIGGAGYILRGAHPRATTGPEPTPVPAGTVADSSSVAVGATSSSVGRYSVTIGELARVVSGVDAVVIGTDAAADGVQSMVVIGTRSRVGQHSVVVGTDLDISAHGQVVAIGSDVTVGGSGTVGIGRAVTAAAGSVTIGQGANTTGAVSVAVGTNATAAHERAVAIGYASATTGLDQVAIGGRHIEFTETYQPTQPPADKARLYVRDNGTGKGILCIAFPTGPEIVLATEA